MESDSNGMSHGSEETGSRCPGDYHPGERLGGPSLHIDIVGSIHDGHLVSRAAWLEIRHQGLARHLKASERGVGIAAAVDGHGIDRFGRPVLGAGRDTKAVLTADQRHIGGGGHPFPVFEGDLHVGIGRIRRRGNPHHRDAFPRHAYMLQDVGPEWPIENQVRRDSQGRKSRHAAGDVADPG